MNKRPKILLVDDVDFFIELEKDFLKRTPADILTARNGQQALDIVRREKPDMVFMDVDMPIMDGLACCRQIKADPALKSTPVIMVYAPTKATTNATCQAAGCDGILNKPVDRAAFLDLGRKFLFAIERREKRIPCQMTVTFQTNGVEYQGIGLDISPNGLYIQFRQTVKAEELLRLSFLLPTVCATPIEAVARIAWINQGFPRQDLGIPQGFGVQFQQISPASLASVHRYLEQYQTASNRGGTLKQ